MSNIKSTSMNTTSASKWTISKVQQKIILIFNT